MSQSASSLGRCPLCGAAVSQNAVLIEYEADSKGRLYAKCPRCKEPVQPQQTDLSERGGYFVERIGLGIRGVCTIYDTLYIVQAEPG